MLVSLAIRNVSRNLRRLAPMIATIVVAFMIMLAGNAVLSYSRDSLFSTFAGTVAGELSVSSVPEASQFTIFGSDALLVGEYLVPPTMVEFPRLDAYASAHADVVAASPVVTGISRVEIMNQRAVRTVLGIDFDRHWEAFPDIELVAGRFPETGERALMVQDTWTSPDLVGQTAVLTTAQQLSFTIRELPVVGVFRFPVRDDLLDRIVFADADTVRSLSGYVFGSGSAGVDVSDADRDALDRDFDDLFGGDDAFVEDSDTSAPIDLDALFADNDEPTSEPDRETVEGAWNFLLLRLRDSARTTSVSRDFEQEGFSRDAGFQIRDWRATVGGTAQIVWFLQLLFNTGIIFVAVGAALVTTNALVLSVLERTSEIGSMRALGATRTRIAALLFLETSIIVMGASLAGLFLGSLAVLALNAIDFVTTNQYLVILFGGDAVRGSVNAALLGMHVLASVLLSAVAVVYPLKRAFAIQPVEAMVQ